MGGLPGRTVDLVAGKASWVLPQPVDDEEQPPTVRPGDHDVPTRLDLREVPEAGPLTAEWCRALWAATPWPATPPVLGETATGRAVRDGGGGDLTRL
jgi:hypothetical protein